MSYPRFINGRPVFGPPLPLQMLASDARREANTINSSATPTRQRVLTERLKRGARKPPSTPSTQPEAVKCTTCNDLELRTKDDDSKYPSNSKQIDVKALRKTAAIGCPSCSMLLEGITRSNVSLDGIDRVTLNTLLAGSTLVVMAGNSGSWTRDDNTYLEFYTKPDAPARWVAIGPGRDVSRDSASQECLELAQTWLWDCLRDHSKCRRMGHGKLPTRLLDVGFEGSDPNVVITAEMSDTEGMTYAALSHCWGPSKPIMTETTTLAQRREGIAFSAFPKTFQDAITVARELDIPYLWIDSLCILQDSPEDWAQEAEQMATVYANAILTIAADASPDAHGGLFVAGEGRPNPVSIKCPGPAGNQSNVYVRPRAVRRAVNEVSHTYADTGRSKLTTRGWVLQERLLSPRTLHYTKNEMAWECSSYLRCECAATAEKADIHSFKARHILRTAVNDYGERAGTGISNSLEDTKEWKRRVKEGGEGAPIMLLNWHNVVWEFTARQLTVSSDRLPAMSGLAATMERATSNLFTANSYVCGLWRRTLALDLCWYSVEFDGSETGLNIPSRRQTDFFAPSWSWVSVTGRISYNGVFQINTETLRPDKVKSQIFAIDASYTPAAGNRFGNAQDGRLTILGYFTPVQIQTSRIPDAKQVCGAPMEYHLVISKKATERGSCPSACLDPDVKGDGYEINADDSYFVLLVAAETESRSYIGYCLVLKAMVGQSGEYQRVGLMRTQHSTTEDWKETGRELFGQKLVIV